MKTPRRAWRNQSARGLRIVVASLGLLAGLAGLSSCQTDQSAGGGYLANQAAIAKLAEEPLPSQPWEFGQIPGLKITSAHYDVYTTVRDPVYQRLLIKVLEADRARFDKIAPGGSASVPHGPKGGGLECYVFGDRRQWEFYTRKHNPLNSEIYLRIAAGGYSQEGIFAGYDLGREQTLSVIAHEAWHQYSWFAFKDKLPSFLEEGMATQNEAIEWDGTTPRFVPEQNLRRFRAVREAMLEKRLWSLEELSRSHAGQAIKKQPRDTDAYYGQVWSFVLFLKQSPKYHDKFLDMIKRAQEGRLHQALDGQPLSGNDFARFSEHWNTLAGPAYLRAFITPDVATLEKEYLKYISDLTSSWPPKTKNAEF